MAERRGRERFLCEQPPYSILVRGIERYVLPACQRYGMGVILWSPLDGGWLSGKWRQDSDDQPSRARHVPRRFDLEAGIRRKLEIVEALTPLAEQAGMTPGAARCRLRDRASGGDRGDHRPAHDGPSRVASLAGGLDPSAEVLDRIDAIVPPGTTMNPADAGWENPALDAAARRR